MTISFTVWTLIGATIEIVLVVVLLIVLRMWFRVAREFRSATDAARRAIREQQEKSGKREG